MAGLRNFVRVAELASIASVRALCCYRAYLCGSRAALKQLHTASRELRIADRCPRTATGQGQGQREAFAGVSWAFKRPASLLGPAQRQEEAFHRRGVGVVPCQGTSETRAHEAICCALATSQCLRMVSIYTLPVRGSHVYPEASPRVCSARRLNSLCGDWQARWLQGLTSIDVGRARKLWTRFRATRRDCRETGAF